MSASGRETVPAPLSAFGWARRCLPAPVRMPRGGRLPTTWLILAVASLLFRGAGHTPDPARRIGVVSGSGEKCCGQYDSVMALPLRDEEAKVGLGHRVRRDEARPASEATSPVRAQAITVSARD